MGPRDREGSHGQTASDERPRCVACGDVIGVYEPLVRVLGIEVLQTSRAGGSGLEVLGGALYHRDCYERVGAGNGDSGSE